MGPDALVLAMRPLARPLPDASSIRGVVLKLTDSRGSGRDSVVYLATVTGTTRAWKSLITGGVGLGSADGGTIDGDEEAVQALIDATELGIVLV